eukprot:1701813-Amphidinium_carterae.1
MGTGWCVAVAHPRGAERAAVADPGVQESVTVDIFDLGLLLLVSALGGFDVLLDAIPYAREFGSKDHIAGPLLCRQDASRKLCFHQSYLRCRSCSRSLVTGLTPPREIFQDTCSLLRNELNSEPDGLLGLSEGAQGIGLPLHTQGLEQLFPEVSAAQQHTE